MCSNSSNTIPSTEKFYVSDSSIVGATVAILFLRITKIHRPENDLEKFSSRSFFKLQKKMSANNIRSNRRNIVKHDCPGCAYQGYGTGVAVVSCC
jgi:hypothetical protein